MDMDVTVKAVQILAFITGMETTWLTQSRDTTDRGVQGVRGVVGPGHGTAEPGVRYRLDVVAADVADVVRFAGGWLFDRTMAGWDVTVLLADHADERPLQILGAQILDLEYALATVGHRPPPQTLAAAADLFDCDSRVRQGVLQALDQGATEVTLWGQTWPVELDSQRRPRRAPAQRRGSGVQGAGTRGSRVTPPSIAADRDVPQPGDGRPLGGGRSRSRRLTDDPAAR